MKLLCDLCTTKISMKRASRGLFALAELLVFFQRHVTWKFSAKNTRIRNLQTYSPSCMGEPFDELTRNVARRRNIRSSQADAYQISRYW